LTRSLKKKISLQSSAHLSPMLHRFLHTVEY
jgi:hypothetical protein